MFSPKVHTNNAGLQSNLFGQMENGFIQPKLNINKKENEETERSEESESTSELVPPSSSTQPQEEENQELGTHSSMVPPSADESREEEEGTSLGRRDIEEKHSLKNEKMDEEEPQKLKRPTTKQLVKTFNRSEFGKHKVDCVKLAKRVAKIINGLINKGIEPGIKEYKGSQHLRKVTPLFKALKKQKSQIKELDGIHNKVNRLNALLNNSQELNQSEIKSIKKELEDAENKLIRLEENYHATSELIKKLRNSKKQKRLHKRNAPYCKKAIEIKDQHPEVFKKGSKYYIKYPAIEKEGGKIVVNDKTVELLNGMRIYTSEKCDEDNTWNNRHMFTYIGGGKFMDRINHKRPAKTKDLGPVYRKGKNSFFIVLYIKDNYDSAKK